MSSQANITRIKAVHNALGSLRDQVVFVGGATVALYADTPAAEARPTDDVDILIEIATRWDFGAVEEQLRQMGFANDRESHFLGRYLLSGLIVDVMPTDPEILGFANRWYNEGFKTAVNYIIDEQNTVKIFAPPYFIASKLEAFKNRGNNDGRQSADFEDIVYVLENRRVIWEEMNAADEKLRSYLLMEFKTLRKNPYIEEWIDANANYFSPSSSLFILDEIDNFIG